MSIQPPSQGRLGHNGNEGRVSFDYEIDSHRHHAIQPVIFGAARLERDAEVDLPVLLCRTVGLDEDVGPVVRDEMVARVDIRRGFGAAGAGEGPVGSEVEDFACWMTKRSGEVRT